MKHLFLILLFSLPIFSQDVNSVLDEIKSSNFDNNIDLSNQDSNNQLLEEEFKQKEDKERDQRQKEKSMYFGFDYLQSLSTKIPSYNALPVSSDYNISFNDNLRLIFSGAKNKIFNLRVGLDGAILIPEVGRVQAVGKNFNDLKDSISSLIDASYVGVNVDLSVIELSAKKISIIGAVKNPGVYLVNPYTTISNCLAYVDGLENFASLRNIKLVKNTGEEFQFDLYDLIINGDRSDDIVVSAGDTVIVQSTDNYVSVEGAIHREYIYEYRDSDTYDDLLKFALGRKKDADAGKIFIDYQNGSIIKTKEVNPKDSIRTTVLEKLFVPKKTSVNLKDIKVNGDSIEDGYYSPEIYKNLKQLFENIKPSDNFYPFFGLLKQSNPYTLESKTVVFNASDLNSLQSIKLSYNDELFFFSFGDVKQFNDYKKYLEKEKEREETENMDAQNKPSLNGIELGSDNDKNEVANTKTENKQSFDETYFEFDLFAEEKVERFGKFYTNNSLFNAMNANLLALNYGGSEINYLPVGPNIIPASMLSYLPYGFSDEDLLQAKVSSNQQHSKEAGLNDVISNPNGSSITIPSSEINFYEVEIEGHVTNPGSYRISRNTTLQELYDIAGGFLVTADQDSIIFQREKIKEQENAIAKKARQDILDTLISSLSNVSSTTPPSIDSSLLAFYQETSNIDFSGRYSGDVSNNSINAKKLTLENEDYIYVPPIQNSISVIGQVQNQITLSYDNMLDINDYIRMSGGFAEYADKKGIYIVSSNGVSRYASRKLFRNDEFFLSPGDTIVVPREFGQVKGVALASIAVSALSDLAIAAASLNSISR